MVARSEASEGFSYKLRHDFEIPNGENSRNWVANVVLKFHDDPAVNESEIVIFLRWVRWPAEKREGFGRREKGIPLSSYMILKF